MSISYEIINSKSLPPNYPCFYGSKVHFQWFYHLMVALTSMYSGVDVFYLMPFLGVYMLILFSLISFMIASHHLKEFKISFLAMVIFMLFFLGKYTDPNYNGYGLIIALLSVYIFMKFIESKSNQFAVLTGIVAGSLIYFHAFSFFFVSLFFLSFALYKLIFGFGKKDLLQILLMATPFALAIPYLVSVTGYTESFFLFEPFGGLLLNYILKFNILLVALPFGIILAVKKFNETSLVFISFLITLFVVLNTFVTTKTPAYLYFFEYMVIPITLVSLKFVSSLPPTMKNLFVVVVIVLLLYPFLDYIRPLYKNQNILLTDEYTASKWIKDNTATNATILTSDYPLYIALSGRKTIVCQTISLIGEHLNPRENFADLIMLYTNPSRDLIEKYNISYIMIGKMEKEFFKKYDLTPYNFTPPAFEIAYSYGSVTIFRVVEKDKIPSTVNENIRNSLNFTSYSRWWQI